MVGGLFSERLTLVKKDGTVAKNGIAAAVQKTKIYTKDASLILEPDDHILRTIPNGMVEDYIVVDAHFRQGGSLSHWEIDVRRSGSPIASPQTVINNITGHNARVNINSTDNSTNAVSENSEKLFAELSAALVKGVANQDERDRLLQAVHAMKEGQKSGSFKENYQNFINSAADHITVVAPFLPALSQLL